jgi:hypothetical protein
VSLILGIYFLISDISKLTGVDDDSSLDITEG